jgi:hypothetical protein
MKSARRSEVRLDLQQQAMITSASSPHSVTVANGV